MADSSNPDGPMFPDYLGTSWMSLKRIPEDIYNYWHGLPASTGELSSAIVGAPNYAADAVARMATRGQYGYPELVEAAGLPANASRESIDRFKGAYGPALGVGAAAGEAGLGLLGAGVNAPTPQMAWEMSAPARAAYARAAAEAGRGPNVFVGVPPGPLYDAAVEAIKARGPFRAHRDLGVVSGPTGKIEREIPDTSAYIKNPSNYSAGDVVPLRDFYIHPELYDSFPELGDSKVYFLNKGTAAPLTSGGGSDLVVNLDNPSTRKYPDIIQRELPKYIQYTLDRQAGDLPVAFNHDFKKNVEALRDSIKRADKIAGSSSDPEEVDAMKTFSARNQRVIDDIYESEGFGNNPSENKILKNSVQYYKKRNQEQPVTLTESEIQDAARKYLHDMGAGNVRATTARERAASGRTNFPFEGKPSAAQLAYPTSWKMSDENFSKMVMDWKTRAYRPKP